MTNDVFKIFGDFKTPAFDFNSLFDVQRRNLEAWTQAGQIVADGAQKVAKKQAEELRKNTDTVLNVSKEFTKGGSPEFNLEKQTELAKQIFEKGLSNSREVSEAVSKYSFEAFDLLNKRAQESFEELGSVAKENTKKAKNAAAA